MSYLLFMLATIASLAIIRIHERVFKQVLNKRIVLVVALLLGYAIAWGGSKGGGEEPPPEPPPDEPIVENVRLRLIGRINEQGQFVPLTSEWVEATTTNGVIEAEQLEEIINE